MTTQQLDALLKVIDSGSFSAAAAQLGINTSSVSRLIQNLEEEIGFTLLHRTTRKLTLTPAGQIYSEQIRQVLQGLQTAQQKALDIQQNLTGKLRVTLPIDFGEEIIIPLIPKFMQQHPKIDLELLLSNDCLNLEKEQIDSAIRLGHVAEQSYVARPLRGLKFVMVASPKFCESLPKKPTPEELTTCAAINFLPELDRNQWLLQKEQHTKTLITKQTLYVSNARAAKNLCLLNQGIACLPDWLVEKELQQQKLISLLGGYHISRPSAQREDIWMVYPSRAYLPKKAQAWHQFLLENLKEPPRTPLNE